MSIHTQILKGSEVDRNAGITADVNAAVAAAGGLRLTGYSCRESAGAAAAATIAIVHGATVAGGTQVVYVELAANGSETVWLGDAGISVDSGISIEVIAGTADVNLFYKVAV